MSGWLLYGFEFSRGTRSLGLLPDGRVVFAWDDVWKWGVPVLEVDDILALCKGIEEWAVYHEHSDAVGEWILPTDPRIRNLPVSGIPAGLEDVSLLNLIRERARDRIRPRPFTE